MFTTNCAVTDCGTYVYAKGFCQKHYARTYKYGTPDKVIKFVGENRHKHPLYKLYHGMLDRCRNPNNTHFKYYGGRGIQVCERWQGPKGFTHFLEDMGERPQGLTLDRIDNNGNYEPGNVRWATRKQQIANTRIPTTNTSGVKGVHLYKATGKWSAYIYKDRKRKHLGYFSTKIEAMKARERAEGTI